ncbi:hypothetical protein V6N11_043782 [Hibiscus sabdariffa]|uniref:Reverse transcriptase zinc-binding domain-containing protein n=1 Tax=Hibiscus sabdariffa TaxID=183260 RepID=A0ABR2RD93_9ROSI
MPILLQIAAMKAPFGIRIPDQFCCGVTSNKLFSVRSGYEVRMGVHHGPTEQIWTTVSRFKGLPRIRYFLWLLCHGRILTNVERYRRHLTLDCCCSVCGDEWEDMDHIFRRCPVAYSIWDMLIRADKKEEFYLMDFKRWFFVNLSNIGGFSRDQVHWDILFGSLLWCLWKKRNEWIFGDPDRYSEPILQRGLRLQQKAIAACSTNAAEQLRGPVIANVLWHKPPPGWCKLNVDGSVGRDTGMAAYGGVVRNEEGT